MKIDYFYCIHIAKLLVSIFNSLYRHFFFIKVVSHPKKLLAKMALCYLNPSSFTTNFTVTRPSVYNFEFALKRILCKQLHWENWGNFNHCHLASFWPVNRFPGGGRAKRKKVEKSASEAIHTGKLRTKFTGSWRTNQTNPRLPHPLPLHSLSAFFLSAYTPVESMFTG